VLNPFFKLQVSVTRSPKFKSWV